VDAPLKRIGRYEIIKPLARGGMGTVYLARDPALDREVALKLLSLDDNADRRKILRAISEAARLQHPNIATILDAGEEDGHLFVAKEYIRGKSLAEIISERQPLPLTRRIEIAEGVCAGLEYAHQAGIVHGSIAPSKIMVTPDGTPKILDFGEIAAASAGSTASGMIVGAPGYLSPEQVSGAATDARSDVFALGALLYELMTYEKAFHGNSVIETLLHVIKDEPVPVASLIPDLPPDLGRIIERSLKKDPAYRYEDAGIMRRELSRVGQEPDVLTDAYETVPSYRMKPVPSPRTAAPPPPVADQEVRAESRSAPARSGGGLLGGSIALVRDVAERIRDAVTGRRKPTPPVGRREAEDVRRKAEIVPVFYATDRARIGRTEPVTYGSERSLSGLAYGCAFVSIPPGHRRGHLERPSVVRLQFREEPDRHVVAMSVTEYTKDTFFDVLRKAMSGGEERSTFVFIHGFNVDFNEAVRRTAQLGFDLGLRKAPILYSWPSQGSALQYIADTNAATWTVPHLMEFLRDLQEHSGATCIHLIAHSMGNQALTGALRLLREDAARRSRFFKQVVLTAPDLDAHVFERDLAPRIVGIGERTTLYASSRDEVLTISKRLNAYRRAGDAAEGIVVVEGVDSIDASQVSTGLGHSSYGDVRTVVEDLSLLLRLGLPPGSRNLVARGSPPKQHWVFPA
jgi:esterase/lipase superfamily enzyme/predicted Ser/Thr protein kinase